MQDKRLDTARKLVDVSKQLLEVMNRLSALTEELVTELEGHATVAINPVWALVPPVARFIAKDANGKWYWYTKRPSANNSIVWHVSGDCEYGRIKNCPLPDAEWQESLIERPNPVTVDSGVWSLVPDNANFVAKDGDCGTWYWYTDKPEPYHPARHWTFNGENGEVCGLIDDCPLTDVPWDQSLIERPQTTPNKPPHTPKPFDWSVPIRK